MTSGVDSVANDDSSRVVSDTSADTIPREVCVDTFHNGQTSSTMDHLVKTKDTSDDWIDNTEPDTIGDIVIDHDIGDNDMKHYQRLAWSSSWSYADAEEEPSDLAWLPDLEALDPVALFDSYDGDESSGVHLNAAPKTSKTPQASQMTNPFAHAHTD